MRDRTKNIIDALDFEATNLERAAQTASEKVPGKRSGASRRLRKLGAEKADRAACLRKAIEIVRRAEQDHE